MNEFMKNPQLFLFSFRTQSTLSIRIFAHEGNDSTENVASHSRDKCQEKCESELFGNTNYVEEKEERTVEKLILYREE
jgi:hypothetical protein